MLFGPLETIVVVILVVLVVAVVVLVWSAARRSKGEVSAATVAAEPKREVGPVSATDEAATDNPRPAAADASPAADDEDGADA